MSDTRITTDLSAWPLVLVTMPPEAPTDTDVLRCIDDQRAMLQRREKHALLCDARHAIPMPATQRRLWAEWLAESEPLSKRYTIAMAVVASSSLIRGALTAVTWLRKPSVELVVHATMADGAAACLHALRAAGVPELAAAEAFVRDQ